MTSYGDIRDAVQGALVAPHTYDGRPCYACGMIH